MSQRSLRTALLGALALAANLLLAPMAQAGVYVGRWDPTYGAPYPTTLGWRGEAKFDIPSVPGCNTDGAACVGGATIASAQVLFYDTGTNANIAQIDWNTGDLSGVALNGLLFSGNAPVQFATDPFPFRSPVLYQGVNGVEYGNFDVDLFSLVFVIDQQPIAQPGIAVLAAAAGPAYSGPLLVWRGSDCNIEFCPRGVNDFANFPATLVVTQVPEPGSLALLAGALLAAGVAARRRRG